MGGTGKHDQSVNRRCEVGGLHYPFPRAQVLRFRFSCPCGTHAISRFSFVGTLSETYPPVSLPVLLHFCWLLSARMLVDIRDYYCE